MNTVDQALYRPLQNGKAFQGLIPAFLNVDVQLDKAADKSNTYDTLRYMDQWAAKYAYQMARVAPLLKGNTLQETANNIYSFLYNHFQYKLDGATQNLYSPSAAWHFRQTGFDCKTFSVLASTILRNLNISHAFRQVQQAGLNPGKWSHVYVIVPNGNSHYTIDATTHNNKEVMFTKKYDHMIHRGLASPAVRGLGCACSGTPILQTGLGNPMNLQATIANFHKFLNVLEQNGISRHVTDRMLLIVKNNVSNGIDPIMNEVLTKALTTTANEGLGLIATPITLSPTARTTGVLTTPITDAFLYQKGLGVINGGSTFSIPTRGTSMFTTPTLNTFTTPTRPGATTPGTFTVQGLDAMNLFNVMSGNSDSAGKTELIKQAFKIIGNFIGKSGWFNRTFGSIFANGFDLSCYGASTPGSVTSKWLDTQVKIVYDATLGKNQDQASFDLFMDGLNWMESKARQWSGTQKASCSKKGLNSFADSIVKIREEFLNSLKSQGITLEKGAVVSFSPGVKLSIPFTEKGFYEYDKNWNSQRYTITGSPEMQKQNGGIAATDKKKSNITPFIIGAGILAKILM